MAGSSNYTHIDVDEIVQESDKAFLCQIGNEEHWLPKSQIADAEAYAVGDKDVTLSITDWLANEKGLSS